MEERQREMNKISISKPIIPILIMVLLLLTMAPLWASGSSGGDGGNADATANANANSNSTSEAISAASALSTGGASSAVVNSSTRAYSVSGSDMAIRDCLATHAVLFGLWQGTHINALCEAAGMNADGKYLAAAKMKCSIKHFRKVYGKGQKCIDSVILSAPPEQIVMLTPPDDDGDDDGDDDRDVRYMVLEERLNAMDADRVRMDKARAYNIKRYEREKAAQKQADADFYGGYIDKFETMQQQGTPDNE